MGQHLMLVSFFCRYRSIDPVLLYRLLKNIHVHKYDTIDKNSKMAIF